MRRTATAAILTCAISNFGCEPPKQTTNTAATPKPVVEEPQFAPPPQPKLATTTNQEPESTAADDVVRERATSAVTAKGKYEVDLITQPVSAYFAVKDQVVFQVQIPKAMQYFELAKDRKPASHEEFMNEIIKRQAIKLPELMPGHRYVYDPVKAELLVERPR